MTRVLVVDDDPQIRRALQINLAARDYAVDTAATGRDALTRASAHPPDLVILDLGLPDLDGVDVIHGLRGWTDAPIIVLSGRIGSSDKVSALDAGADDYVTKPFGMDELLARMRAAARRAPSAESPDAAVVTFGPITVDLAAHQVTRAEADAAVPIRLTPTEWHLLEVLVRQPGKLLNQRYLLTQVWGSAYVNQPANLRLYMAQLRHKLEPDPTRPRYLLTEPGMGYRFQPGTQGDPVASVDGPTMRALTALRDAPTMLGAIARWDDLLAATRQDDPVRAGRLLAAAVADDSDAVTAIAAIHALAVVPETEHVTRVMTDLLVGGTPHLREHAAWALGAAPPIPAAIPELSRLVRDGSFPGTLAQLTLEAWGKAAPELVGTALLASLSEPGPPAGRARLVETLGLVPWSRMTSRLVEIAVDPTESTEVRASAIAALGESDSVDDAVGAALAAVASGGGPLAAVAQLAGDDLARAGSLPGGPPGDRLTVAQLFLHADIDGGLRHAGQGDTGGIATLLVHLGEALLEQGPIRRVLTVSRGTAGELEASGQLRGAELERPGHHYLGVPLRGPALHAADAWTLRVAVRRGLRRILRSTEVHVLHLRMADVGSWAAATVAQERGIPTVLTLAPDPHALIAAQETDGSLTRATFGEADRAGHLTFRVRLLRELADQAARLVVFPRPQLERDLRDLLGLELSSHPEGVAVVPEGIDLGHPDRALREVPLGGTGLGESTREALEDLDRLLETLPAGRRDLPLGITVGRLHPVKGMATLVRAWAGDRGLNARCNLLVVGGDLHDPSDVEAEELALIDAVIPRDEGPTRGLLLAGHRPNATVATWLAAVRFGRPGRCAPLGVYVSASLKEEFGIAILEAMATGLVVVAPRVGGPATYVVDGVSGVLADTTSPENLCRAVTRALDLAARPDADVRAQDAIALVRDRFSIDTMAATLAGLYEEVSRNRTAPGPAARVLP